MSARATGAKKLFRPAAKRFSKFAARVGFGWLGPFSFLRRVCPQPVGCVHAACKIPPHPLEFEQWDTTWFTSTCWFMVDAARCASRSMPPAHADACEQAEDEVMRSRRWHRAGCCGSRTAVTRGSSGGLKSFGPRGEAFLRVGWLHVSPLTHGVQVMATATSASTPTSKIEILSLVPERPVVHR